MKTKTEIIEGMLDLLNSPEKWCKGVLYREDGAYCLLGAFNQALTGHWMWTSALHEAGEPRELIALLADLACERGYEAHFDKVAPIVAFNNAHETEYEDVRLFLKEALERVA